MRISHIVICSLCVSTVFFPHYLTKGKLKKLCVYVYRVQNVFLRCPTPRLHCFLSSHGPLFRFLSLLNLKCVFCFLYNFENVLILRSTERGMIINVYSSSYKVRVIFVRFYLNKNFLDIFSKNSQILNYMTIRPMGAEMIHADGRTDRHDEASSCVSQYAKPPTGSTFCTHRVFMSFVCI